LLSDDIPIHSKHVVVEKHQIDGMGGEQLQSVCAAGGDQDLAPSFLKQLGGQFE
jgi:hypothetical protein